MAVNFEMECFSKMWEIALVWACMKPVISMLFKSKLTVPSQKLRSLSQLQADKYLACCLERRAGQKGVHFFFFFFAVFSLLI